MAFAPPRIDQRSQAQQISLAKPTQEEDRAATTYLLSRTTHDASHITGMTPEARVRIAAMIAAAPPDIREKMSIGSGARTFERQKELYIGSGGYQRPNGTWTGGSGMVARPGHSQHESGVAADLAYNGKFLGKAPQEVQDWFHENAATYGLKFRMNNPNRHPYEPWHIETQETFGGKPFKEEGMLAGIADKAWKLASTIGQGAAFAATGWSRPDQVKSLQQALNAAGFTGEKGRPLAVDGDFGPQTQNALNTLREMEGIARQGANANLARALPLGSPGGLFGPPSISDLARGAIPAGPNSAQSANSAPRPAGPPSFDPLSGNSGRGIYTQVDPAGGFAGNYPPETPRQTFTLDQMLKAFDPRPVRPSSPPVAVPSSLSDPRAAMARITESNDLRAKALQRSIQGSTDLIREMEALTPSDRKPPSLNLTIGSAARDALKPLSASADQAYPSAALGPPRFSGAATGLTGSAGQSGQGNPRSYTPFTPASAPASAPQPRSYTPFTPAPAPQPTPQSRSYTPFTPAPVAQSRSYTAGAAGTALDLSFGQPSYRGPLTGESISSQFDPSPPRSYTPFTPAPAVRQPAPQYPDQGFHQAPPKAPVSITPRPVATRSYPALVQSAPTVHPPSGMTGTLGHLGKEADDLIAPQKAISSVPRAPAKAPAPVFQAVRPTLPTVPVAKAPSFFEKTIAGIDTALQKANEFGTEVIEGKGTWRDPVLTAAKFGTPTLAFNYLNGLPGGATQTQITRLSQLLSRGAAPLGGPMAMFGPPVPSSVPRAPIVAKAPAPVLQAVRPTTLALLQAQAALERAGGGAGGGYTPFTAASYQAAITPGSASYNRGTALTNRTSNA